MHTIHLYYHRNWFLIHFYSKNLVTRDPGALNLNPFNSINTQFTRYSELAGVFDRCDVRQYGVRKLCAAVGRENKACTSMRTDYQHSLENSDKGLWQASHIYKMVRSYS